MRPLTTTTAPLTPSQLLVYQAVLKATRNGRREFVGILAVPEVDSTYVSFALQSLRLRGAIGFEHVRKATSGYACGGRRIWLVRKLPKAALAAKPRGRKLRHLVTEGESSRVFTAMSGAAQDRMISREDERERTRLQKQMDAFGAALARARRTGGQGAPA